MRRLRRRSRERARCSLR
ncbi:hypothetical protein [Eubacterium sp. An3]|nr:hypothetical protein [Eubacterium sp. An3]